MAPADDPSSSSSSSQPPRDGRAPSSPWSHVVRGEAEPAAAPSPPSPPAPAPAPIPPPGPSDRSPLPVAATVLVDEQPAGAPPDAPLPGDGGGGGGAGARGKKPKPKPKPAWSRPSNGAVEAGPVMGAASWPALSEAARASARSAAPSDSGKGLSDGSVSAPPATVNVITSSPPSQIAKNANFGPSANHGSPTRQKSMKRAGGSSAGTTIANNSSGALANGGPVPPSSLPTSAEVPGDSSDKPVTSQLSSRDLNNRGSSNWDHGSRGGGSPQSHGGSEHHRNYGNNRRGNSGGGGGAPYHNNFVNRRGSERGGHEWNNHSFNGGRDLQLQQQQQPRAMARPFLRPLPPGSAPFMSPPLPVRPFASPMGYYDMHSPVFYVPTHPSPESHGGMPFFGPPAMFYVAPDAQLRATLANQIDYYFSPENLCKDIYLRQNMDEEGWVSISLIASFNRVRNLTNNVQFILDTVRTSSIVEVQGDKIRRRNDWMNWPSLASAPNQPLRSTVPSYETLAAQVRNVKLEERGTSQNSVRVAASPEAGLSRSLSETSQSQVAIASNGKGPGQSTPLTSSADLSVSMRSLGRSDTF